MEEPLCSLFALRRGQPTIAKRSAATAAASITIPPTVSHH